jgi:transcriptional regulator with XRE-family HTH domain
MIQGDCLREVRQQRGLSQAALGHRLGLDGQYIYKLEHGVLRSMTTTTLERLVHALHVSADYLLGLSDCVGEACPDTNGAPTRRRPRRVTRAPGLTDTTTPEQPDTAPTAIASLPEPQQQHAMPGRPQMCPHCAIPLQPLEGQLGLVCPACRYRREEG